MAALTDPKLGLSYGWALGEDGWNTGYNETIVKLSALVQGVVINSSTTAPPVTPSEGDMYVIAATATGDWTGKEKQIAYYIDGAWVYYTPNEGMCLYNLGITDYIVYEGGAWILESATTLPASLQALYPMTSVSSSSLVIGTSATAAGGTSTVYGNYAAETTSTAVGGIYIGDSAGRYKDAGDGCVFVGRNAGSASTGTHSSGIGQTYVGRSAGAYNVANYNTALGYYALEGIDGSSNGISNLAAGYQAGRYVSTATYGVMLGYQAGIGAVGNPNTSTGQIAIGYNAGYYGTGNYNISMGYAARNGVAGGTSGGDNVSIGHSTSSYLTIGSYDIHIGTEAGYASATTPNTGAGQFYAGYQAGKFSIGNYNVAAGHNAFTGIDSITTAAYTTAIGNSAGFYKSTGDGSVLIGRDTGGASNTNRNAGVAQVYVGSQTGRYATGSYNVALGSAALYGVDGSTTAVHQVAAGYQTLYYKTTGDNCIGFGREAGTASATTPNTGIGQFYAGYQAGKFLIGNYNIGLGYSSLTSVDGSGTATGNIALGYQSGIYKTTGNNSVYIGYQSGTGSATTPMTGATQISIGVSAGRYNIGANNIAIGNTALNGVDGSSTGATNVAIGVSAGNGITTGSNHVIIGNGAGQYVTTGVESVLLGWNAGQGSATNPNTGGRQVYAGDNCGRYSIGSYNIALGLNSLVGVDGSTTGTDNVALGRQVLQNVTTAAYNFASGYLAGNSRTTGDYSIMIGYSAGAGTTTNKNTGAGQIYLGYLSGQYATGAYNVAAGHETMLGVDGSTTATYSVAIGYRSQKAITTGSYNVTLGYQSGDSITTGGKNIVIGYNADLVAATDSDKLVIDNTATATRFMYGDMTSTTANRYLQLDGRLYTSGITMLSTDTLKIGTTSSSDYGWDDYTTDLTVRGSGANDPSWAVFRDTIYAYEFSASTMCQCWAAVHIKHDYAEGTVVYPHVHWAPNTTSTGVVRWGFEYTVAKGHQQSSNSDFAATTTVYVEQTISSNVQYRHHLAEVVIGDAIASTKLEPDSLILMRIFRDAAHINDTFPDAVFAFTVDIHYQVAKHSTKNKAPNFNT